MVINGSGKRTHSQSTSTHIKVHKKRTSNEANNIEVKKLKYCSLKQLSMVQFVFILDKIFKRVNVF